MDIHNGSLLVGVCRMIVLFKNKEAGTCWWACEHCGASKDMYAPSGQLEHKADCLDPTWDRKIVHVLKEGLPVCRFTTALPREWPKNMYWVTEAERENASCSSCMGKYEKGE